MTDTLQAAGTMCSVLIASELIARLCPKDSMLGFVKALVALVLAASLGAALLSADWDWPSEAAELDQNSELAEYMQEQYTSAAQEEVNGYLRGLLGSAGLEAKKIRADIHINEDGSISCTKVSLTFTYGSDARRARALLENVLEGVDLEVAADDT